MLGTLRLILALAVATSHAGISLYGHNPGVAAVVGFYLISGYVMAGLLRRHYSQPSQALAFYSDRAIRLLPQYFLYGGITLAWHLSSQITSPFLTHSPTANDVLNNVLVVPLNYYMFNGSDKYTLIPPAWSLGAEIQFYLLAPFVLIWPMRLIYVGICSLGIYLAALAGLINGDWFGYRLLPGVLLFFVLGAWLQDQHRQNKFQRALIGTIGVLCSAGLAIAVLHFYRLLHQAYNLETLTGLMLGVLAIHTLGAASPRKPSSVVSNVPTANTRGLSTPSPGTQPPLLKLPNLTLNRWDILAGDLSYGVFLNHFLVIWTFYPQGISSGQLPLLLLLCVALSYLSQRVVERPLLQLRYKFRKSLGATPG